MAEAGSAAEYEELFAEAVRLFEARDYGDAAVIFDWLAGRDGPRHKEVLAYRDKLSSREKPSEPYVERSSAGGTFAGVPVFRKRVPSRPRPMSGGEASRAKGATAQPIRRTPHLDLPKGALKPEAAFAVTLRVDTRPGAAGEVVEELVFAGTRAVLTARLSVTDHFLLEGDPVREMTIDSSLNEQQAAPFKLRIRSAPELVALGGAAISATFFSDGQPSGRVWRAVPIQGVDAPPPTPPGPSSVRVAPNAAKPDLVVTISTTAANDGLNFDCMVQSPLLSDLVAGKSGPWKLPAVAASLVKQHMDGFTARNLSARQRVAALKGAGKDLFEAAPKVFTDAYWALVDAGRRPKTIAIVSDEPHVPWELMRPVRRVDGELVSEDALGVQCAIGRWVGRNGLSAPQSVPLKTAGVVVPTYAPNRALPHAATEAKKIAEQFNASVLTPVTFDELEKLIRERLGDLLHFACHGVDQGGLQALELEGNTKVTTAQVAGMDGIEKAFGRAHPLVFLNACEVGRTVPALVGSGGFAKTFTDLGASGVVAPLWSVKDTYAHQIAVTFYDELRKTPRPPFAEILRRVRAQAYDFNAGGEDTFAAYCFYGDPLAVTQ